MGGNRHGLDQEDVKKINTLYKCLGKYKNIDVDECSIGNHDCDKFGATCTNTNPGFTCACKSGYTGDGKTCTPTSGDACKDTTFQNDPCGGYAHLCEDTRTTVKQQCPHTCGVCTPDPPSGDACKDTTWREME